MKDFRSQISDFRFLGDASLLDPPLSAEECGGAYCCVSLRPRFLSARVKQSLETRRKRVIPRRGDAEGPHEHSYCQQNIFSLAQMLMRGPSSRKHSGLGMTEEMNSE